MANNSSTVRIVGSVVGKQRPRFSMVNGHAVAYTSKKSASFEAMVGIAYQAQGGTLHHGSVEVTIAYGRVMPKSRPKKTVQEGDVYKPDLDNVAKSVLDALNGIAFEDDKDVVSLKVMKMPRERRTEETLFIEVKEVDTETRQEMFEEWKRFTRLTERLSRS